MDIIPERRPSRAKALQRSSSFSEAIGSDSIKSSIDIPTIANTEVYINEQIKKRRKYSEIYINEEIQRQRRVSKATSVTGTIEEFRKLRKTSKPCEEIDNIDDSSRPSLRSNLFPSGSYKRKVSQTASTVSNVYTIVERPDGSGSDTQSNNDYANVFDSSSSEEERVGLRMSIDVENNVNPRSTGRYTNSTKAVTSVTTDEAIYDTIEVVGSSYTEEYSFPSTHGYYSKRKKKELKHRRRVGRRMKSRRAVCKDGEENVPIRSNIPAKSLKYFRDLVNTVINAKWRFILLLMIILHFIFWFVFAGIWYRVTMSYGDDIGDGKEHCVTGTSSFAGLLMMAVETQMTIGYGVRYPNEECPEAIVVMIIEIIAGTALSGGFVSLLFTKLVRPNRHVADVGFSKKAAVCLRDGQMCLQFRVWDLHNLYIIGSNITAYILKPIRTLEGELIRNYIHQLKLKQANAFLLWPITVYHIIDEGSPLFDLSAQDMMDYRFEIVVCLQGSSKNMGTITQSRTSYLSKEIIWGYRFTNVVRYSKSKEAYIIDVDNLNTVEEVATPLCSASQLRIIQEDIQCSTQNLLSSNNTTDLYNYPSPSDTNSTHIYNSPNLSINGTKTYNPRNYSDSNTNSQNYSSSVGTSANSPTNVTDSPGTGTERSFGWSFKKVYEDVTEEEEVAGLKQSHF